MKCIVYIIIILIYFRYIKEATKYIFNTNVFKKVRFAMDDLEKEKDENLVRDVSTFLKEKAIDKFI